MIDFKQYLKEGRSTEIESIEDFNGSLNKNCKFYLNLIKSLQHPFIREISGLGHYLGIQPVRQDRRPRGTDPATFKEFNGGLQKNGHNRRDNSIMASFKPPGIFGTPCYIFPMGKFSYSGVETQDINFNDDRTGWSRYELDYYDFVADEEESYSKSTLKKPFKDYFHTDEGIEIAAKKEYEVGFNCKQYLFAYKGGSSKYKGDVNKKIMIEFK